MCVSRNIFMTRLRRYQPVELDEGGGTSLVPEYSIARFVSCEAVKVHSTHLKSVYGIRYIYIYIYLYGFE